MSGIGVITNPRSRKNRKNPALVGRLGYVLGERGDLQQPGDLDALDEVAERFRDRDIDVLCINGGDGTLHKAISAMVRAYDGQPLPKVALLCGGTMNTIAKSMGIYGSPGQILENVVDTYHGDDATFQTARRSTLQVGDNYGFLWGTGLFSNYLELYYEGSDPTPLKAAMVLARGIGSTLINGPYSKRMFRDLEATVTWNGETLPGDRWRAVAAGTVDDVGLGFRPFFRCLEHPGKMHGVALSCPVTDVVWELPRVFRAEPLAADDNYEAVTDEIVLQGDAPIGYMMDGDFFTGESELRVQVGPHVEFIVP